jgi:hypothetical protein
VSSTVPRGARVKVRPVTGVGFSKYGSAVPDDWLGRHWPGISGARALGAASRAGLFRGSWDEPGSGRPRSLVGDAAARRPALGNAILRLAIKTDLGSRIVRAWSIVPAAVNEREVAVDLLEAGPHIDQLT